MSHPGIGFQQKDHKAVIEEQRDRITKEMKQTFKPEFINRLTDTLVFNPLTSKELAQIVDLILDDVSNYANEKKVTIILSPAAKALIIRQKMDTEYGARPLRRLIQDMIEDKIAEMTLKGEVKGDATISVSVKKQALTFRVKQNNPALIPKQEKSLNQE